MVIPVINEVTIPIDHVVDGVTEYSETRNLIRIELIYSDMRRLTKINFYFADGTSGYIETEIK